MVQTPADWVNYHLIAALAGVALIGFSFAVQANSVQANYALIQTVMDEVRRIRSDRGLDAEVAGDSSPSTT